ncbi:MAG: hypothetical protein ABII27_07345 [bacterium]
MSKIIIGIHGLSNKPPKSVLEKWWKKSIKEGLKRIGRSRYFLNFTLVYWADCLYEKPLNPFEKNSAHVLYIDDPYIKGVGCNGKGKIGAIKRYVRKNIYNVIENVIFNRTRYFNFNRVAYAIIKKKFKDLYEYYKGESNVKENYGKKVKDIIRERLYNCLIKNKNKEILLIAHSMGSIIAYDVLSMLPPEIKIHGFITIGAPLNNAVIKNNIYEEHKQHYNERLLVPSAIKGYWINLHDPLDVVSQGQQLANIFLPNSDYISVIDQDVCNDYEMAGRENRHKSYGYLRTEQVATFIDEFFEKESIWNKIKKIYNKLTMKKDLPKNSITI